MFKMMDVIIIGNLSLIFLLNWAYDKCGHELITSVVDNVTDQDTKAFYKYNSSEKYHISLQSGKSGTIRESNQALGV